MATNLKGPAVAWYREFASQPDSYLKSVTQFEALLNKKFTPPDIQESLRDQLFRLRQRDFLCLEGYVAAFCNTICKVTEMSPLGIHFQKRLALELRGEVSLRQFRASSRSN